MVAPWLAVLALAGGVVAQDDAKFKDLVAAQKQKAEEQWKTVLEGKASTTQETDLCLVVGNVPVATLDAVGKACDKAVAFAQKTLKLSSRPPGWKGKVIVFVCQERGEYTSLERNVTKRNPDRDDRGSFFEDGKTTIVIVGPGQGGRLTGLDLEAAAQVAAAALHREHGNAIPEWLVNGYGRSCAYQLNPKYFADERKQAAAYLRRGKTARDVCAANLTRDEGPALHASLAAYLATGPGAAKFQDLLIAIGLDDMGNFEEGLKSVKLTVEGLDAGWRAWAFKQ